MSRRVGSGRVGSDRVGSGRVGSDRIGSGRVGSGRVGLLVFCLRLNSDLIFLCCTYFLKKAISLLVTVLSSS